MGFGADMGTYIFPQRLNRTMTLRDEVWGAVLKQLSEGGQFKIGDLPFEESQRHTVRRVLRNMEELEYLERANERGRIWYPGDTARQLIELPEDAESPTQTG